jgi:hypothetical protein
MATRKNGHSLAAARADLRALADPSRAKSTATFFKTAPGDYGEGDVFIGVRVPDRESTKSVCSRSSCSWSNTRREMPRRGRSASRSTSRIFLA